MKDSKSDEEWKYKLKPEVYHILREKGTEPSFSGSLLNEKRNGLFLCAACNNILFKSNDKFDSGSGWPSFSDIASSDSVTFVIDNSYGMKRIEVKCKRCDGHLGHVFDDGPLPTKKRYCINSLALKFDKKELK